MHNHEDYICQTYGNEEIRDEMSQLISKQDIMDHEETFRSKIEDGVGKTSLKVYKDSVQTMFFPTKCWSSEALEYFTALYNKCLHSYKLNCQMRASNIISILENKRNGFHYEWFTHLNDNKEIDCVYWFSAVQKVSKIYILYLNYLTEFIN